MADARERLNRCKNLLKIPITPDRNKTAPKCRQCSFYQPEFRYRICLFSVCPYGKSPKSVFRKKPLRMEKYTAVGGDKPE